MRWLIPLAAVSEISNFSNTTIPSREHFQVTSDAASVTWPWRSFKTSPHTPPHVHITRNGTLSDGYIFLSPADIRDADGTYEMSGTGFIMTSDGDLIYAAEETGMGFCDKWVAGMTDFRKQEYNGRPYLTYWNGCNTKGQHWGHRWGRVTFIDDEYNNFTLNPDLNINTLDNATRGQIDLHEHQMTDRNTLLITSYNNTQFNLSSEGGPELGYVADAGFFEIDIKTQEILFEWRGMEHLLFKDSRFGLGGNRGTERIPWDWLHINSVQAVGENYLISSRHHWAIYLISGKDGHVIWKLDGIDGGSFGSIPVQFRWQHHARAHNVTDEGMTVSLFNNQMDGARNNDTQTQALAYWLPMPASKNHPPVLVRQLQTPEQPLFSATQGSYQLDVGNGNGFVGYGKVPIAREYGPAADGSDLRWQGQFGEEGSVMSYRVFKESWNGTPKAWDPVVVVSQARVHSPKVYVSWNGATDISSWAVYAGATPDNLVSIGIAEKMGFETVFDIEKNVTCVQLGAIRDEHIIRRSNIACLDAAAGPGTEVGYEIYRVGSNGAEEAEVTELEPGLKAIGAGLWISYRLFTEIAAAAIVLIGATWGLMYWLDRRRRRGYSSVPNRADSDASLESVGLVKSESNASDVDEEEKSTLEAYSGSRGCRRIVHAEQHEFFKDDGDDESSQVTARTPFMRVLTSERLPS